VSTVNLVDDSMPELETYDNSVDLVDDSMPEWATYDISVDLEGHPWLSRNHILHLLFSKNRTLCHINICVIETRGIHPRVEFFWYGGRNASNLCTRGLIVVGLMIGCGSI
jgi:hypothetical protein